MDERTNERMTTRMDSVGYVSYFKSIESNDSKYWILQRNVYNCKCIHFFWTHNGQKERIVLHTVCRLDS